MKRKRVVKDLGFQERVYPDSVYEKKHKKPYRIIRKKLNKVTWVDFNQLTGHFTLVVINKPSEGNIVCEVPIYTKPDLMEAIKRKL